MARAVFECHSTSSSWAARRRIQRVILYALALTQKEDVQMQQTEPDADVDCTYVPSAMRVIAFFIMEIDARSLRPNPYQLHLKQHLMVSFCLAANLKLCKRVKLQ